jgi:hypothetical protein
MGSREKKLSFFEKDFKSFVLSGIFLPNLGRGALE